MKYGFGGYDEVEKRTTNFTPLSYFGENQYRVGKVFPDPSLGYLLLTQTGGHPGHDGKHAIIRRWTAPDAMTIQIQGLFVHSQKEGDGVRGRIVSSRHGLLGEWQVHNSRFHTDVASTSVQKGDTIDFVVDPLTNDGFDAFLWSPAIKTIDGKLTWEAFQGFGPPPPPPINRLTLYAQALMMTNEFLFID